MTARRTAGTGNGDPIVNADGVADAVGADRSGGTPATDPSAGDDDCRRAGGAAAHCCNEPHAVEFANTATGTTAFPGGFGLAASCGLFRLHRARRLPRTGKGFLIIADAAACTAGLRQRSTRYGSGNQE